MRSSWGEGGGFCCFTQLAVFLFAPMRFLEIFIPRPIGKQLERIANLGEEPGPQKIMRKVFATLMPFLRPYCEVERYDVAITAAREGRIDSRDPAPC